MKLVDVTHPPKCCSEKYKSGDYESQRCSARGGLSKTNPHALSFRTAIQRLLCSPDRSQASTLHGIPLLQRLNAKQRHTQCCANFRITLTLQS